jgi:integrase
MTHGRLNKMDIDLEHLHTVKKRLASGELRRYYYHRLTGKPVKARYGTLEFIEAFKAASVKDAPPPVETAALTFGDVLRDYQASHDFLSKAASTRQIEGGLLKRVEAKWAALPVLALNDERIRADILEWRDGVAVKSARMADYLTGLLRTVIQWGWDRRKYGITANHASRTGRLHNETRIDSVWTRDKALKLYAEAPEDMRGPILFAFHTSWRQGDILTLDWKAFDGAGFAVVASKNRVPLYAPCTRAMAAFASEHERTEGPVFLTRSGRPWLSKHFQHSFADLAKACGIESLTFHDIRGTVQTVAGEAGLSDLQISAITGHKLKGKNQILGSYASRTKLMAQKVIATLENTWLADIGADLINGPTVNRIVNCR